MPAVARSLRFLTLSWAFCSAELPGSGSSYVNQSLSTHKVWGKAAEFKTVFVLPNGCPTATNFQLVLCSFFFSVVFGSQIVATGCETLAGLTPLYPGLSSGRGIDTR
jgi:hypothetical protein